MATDSVTAPRPVRFSTAGLPDAERIARWEEHNAQALVGLRCRTLGEGILEAPEVNLQLPQLHLARVRGTSHVVERPPEVIRRHPADAIAVYLTLGQAFFYHDDGVRTLRPGQLVVCARRSTLHPRLLSRSRGARDQGATLTVPRADRPRLRARSAGA